MRDPFGGAAVPDDVQGARFQHHNTRQQCYPSFTEPIYGSLESFKSSAKSYASRGKSPAQSSRQSVLSNLRKFVNVDGRSNPGRVEEIDQQLGKRGICMFMVLSPNKLLSPFTKGFT